jgi:hypothetical protein
MLERWKSMPSTQSKNMNRTQICANHHGWWLEIVADAFRRGNQASLMAPPDPIAIGPKALLSD